MSMGGRDKGQSYHVCGGGEGLRAEILSQSCPVALPAMIQITPHISFITCRDNYDTVRDLLDSLHQLSFDPALVSNFKGVSVAFFNMTC